MTAQQELVEAFNRGAFPGSEGSVPQHITTLISHVFLTTTHAYKFYKDDSTFFNANFSDLSDPQTRFAFTSADFAWNQILAPEVYLGLQKVRLEGASVQLSESRPQELVIVMHRVDMRNSLLKRLARAELSDQDFYTIGHQLAERLVSMQAQNRPSMELEENFAIRFQDIAPWAYDADPHLPKAETDEYIGWLKQFYEEKRTELVSVLPAVCLDIHGENALYQDGIFIPMDTYSPKREWATGHPDLNLYRIATDVYAFAGESAFSAVLKGYEAAAGRTVVREYARFFLTYAALIMCPYLYMLAKGNPEYRLLADRYRDFMRIRLTG